MKEDVGFCDFQDRFKEMNRDNNFSYEGKKALFDYLESYEDNIGEAIELDVIALCCEYTEYEDIKEFLNDYKSTIKTERKDFEKDEEDEYKEAVLDELQEHTTVIKVDDDAFIIQCF